MTEIKKLDGLRLREAIDCFLDLCEEQGLKEDDIVKGLMNFCAAILSGKIPAHKITQEEQERPQ